MKIKFTSIVIIGIFLIGFFYIRAKDISRTQTPISPSLSTPITSGKKDSVKNAIVAQNLSTPWAIAFLPDGSILATERPGRVRFIGVDGKLVSNPIATLSQAKEIGEGGLLGITLHPDFIQNHFVYLYYTYKSSGDKAFNRVVRMIYENKVLIDEKIIVDSIPGASNHNGGRIKFGPDGLLYVATGDAQNSSQAQNTTTLGGKILRVTDEGTPAPGNPFGNPVFSYGHRNVQGLAWDGNGNLWATEHGRSGVLSGLDELNFIESGKNYGWPDIQGDEKRDGMETPRKNSGPSATWAPSGAAFIGNSLFFAGLRGQTLYEAVIENDQVTTVKEHFKGEIGRIREVIAGPDGMLYITTSNRDGRGNPKDTDDVILRINPALK